MQKDEGYCELDNLEKENYRHAEIIQRVAAVSVQAFYLPWGEELRRWALTHPEYTRDQIMMLVVCIAEANGLKRKERNAFLSLLEADLSDLRAVP